MGPLVERIPRTEAHEVRVETTRVGSLDERPNPLSEQTVLGRRKSSGPSVKGYPQPPPVSDKTLTVQAPVQVLALCGPFAWTTLVQLGSPRK